jgi:hypothetical protein
VCTVNATSEVPLQPEPPPRSMSSELSSNFSTCHYCSNVRAGLGAQLKPAFLEFELPEMGERRARVEEEGGGNGIGNEAVAP